MHASFIFTKCILYLSGLFKEVLFLFYFYFDYSNLTSFHSFPFTFMSSVLLHTKKTTVILFTRRVKCEHYLVLYGDIYPFFQSHYHT